MSITFSRIKIVQVDLNKHTITFSVTHQRSSTHILFWQISYVTGHLSSSIVFVCHFCHWPLWAVGLKHVTLQELGGMDQKIHTGRLKPLRTWKQIAMSFLVETAIGFRGRFKTVAENHMWKLDSERSIKSSTGVHFHQTCHLRKKPVEKHRKISHHRSKMGKFLSGFCYQHGFQTLVAPLQPARKEKTETGWASRNLLLWQCLKFEGARMASKKYLQVARMDGCRFTTTEKPQLLGLLEGMPAMIQRILRIIYIYIHLLSQVGS